MQLHEREPASRRTTRSPEPSHRVRQHARLRRRIILAKPAKAPLSAGNTTCPPVDPNCPITPYRSPSQSNLIDRPACGGLPRTPVCPCSLFDSHKSNKKPATFSNAKGSLGFSPHDSESNREQGHIKRPQEKINPFSTHFDLNERI